MPPPASPPAIDACSISRKCNCQFAYIPTGPGLNIVFKICGSHSDPEYPNMPEIMNAAQCVINALNYFNYITSDIGQSYRKGKHLGQLK